MSITPTPLITIGITCFNAEKTIERAIQSALKQDWGNVEIIIVDDFSTDSSRQVIQKFIKNNKNIHLHQHPKNLGYPSALNTIIDNATGQYIAFFDDDDDNQPNRLAKQYKRLKTFSEKRGDAPVLCYSNRHVLVNGIEKPEAFVHAIGRNQPEPNGEIVANYLLWSEKETGYCWGEFGSCTLMTKTETLKKFKFNPDFKRCAEWDLAIRIALQGGYFIAVNEPLISQHKTPTDDKAGEKPLQYGLMLRKTHKEYLIKNKAYWGSLMQAYARFHYFRKKKWKSHLYLFLACLLSPTTILISEIKKRIS